VCGVLSCSYILRRVGAPVSVGKDWVQLSRLHLKVETKSSHCNAGRWLISGSSSSCRDTNVSSLTLGSYSLDISSCICSGNTFICGPDSFS
jgi:hypothetical protein